MNISLSKINLLNIFIVILVFSGTIGFFTIQIINNTYKERVISLEKSYIEKNKLLIKQEVERAITRINTLEDISYKSLRSSLEEKVDIVYDLLKSNATYLTKKQLINKYSKQLNAFKWDNDSGYFYIFDNSGTVLFHGANKNYENQNIFDIATGNKELENFLRDSIAKENNYGSYKWYKPNEKVDQLYKKFVYTQKLQSHQIYIAAGIYKSEFIKKVQKTLLKELEKERFGEDDYGYFWVSSLSYKMLMHPIKKEFLTMDLMGFRTLDGQYLFKNIYNLLKKEKKGYIEYRWYTPNTNIEDDKITYVHLIKDWNMVLASGFYLTELKDLLKKENANLENSLQNNLQKVFKILAVLILVSLAISWFISRKILNVELEQKKYLNMLEQYQLILDQSAVVSKTNKQGIITYINDSFVDISGYSKEDAIGRPHNIVRHPETPKSEFKKLWKTILKGKAWKGIIKNKNKQGKSYYSSTTIVPLKNDHGDIIEYISAGFDVTEIFENRSKLQSIFKTDALTGLGNRVSLIDTITKSEQGTLALINIDRFKEINDTHGHEVGDKVIKTLGVRLYKYIEESNYTLFRVQADVFALFFDTNQVYEMASKVENFIESFGKKPYRIEDKTFILTYSSGIASDTENLLTYADMALSEAKSKKLQIKIYEPEMNNIAIFKQNILWVKKLHTAIAEDRIIPYFQPIYNYHTKTIEKYECLMRYIENDQVVSPVEYLHIAKTTKLYPELTYKIAAKSINKFANNKLEFSINLSIEDIMNEKLMQFIYNYAEQKNVFNRMVLEIVESEEMEDSDHVATTIKKFKDAGSKVAIDDFGSGYSNYEYLISLQADYIKIDGSIVKHILEDERTAEVVKSIVNFAQKSNMKTIAEYVSSKELNEKIKELGVDYAQGWFYGKAQKELL